MKNINKIIESHKSYLETNTKLYLSFLETIRELKTDKTQDNTKDGTEGQIILNIHHETWMDDHRPRWGVPVIPMMGMLDMMAHAIVDVVKPKKITGITNAKAHNWLVIQNEVTLKLVLKILNDDCFDVQLTDIKGVLYCSATFTVSKNYPASNITSDDIHWDQYQPIHNPYHSHDLFHGPAFQLIQEMRVSDVGGVARLKSKSETAPSGIINMPLLDASTHLGIVKNIMRWSKKQERDRVWFIVSVNHLCFYSPPPEKGIVELKLDYLGKVVTHDFHKAHIQLFSDTHLWCEYDIMYGGLKLDEETFTQTDYYQFSERRKFVPGLSISKPFKNGYKITNAEWKAQNWPPKNHQWLYHIHENNEAIVIQQTLVKELFSDYFSIHPSYIDCVNSNTIQYQGKQYQFHIDTLEDGYYAEIDRTYEPALIEVCGTSIRLGNPYFNDVFKVKFPYVVGEMANGIAGLDLVKSAAKNRLLSFLGTAGLSLEKTASLLDQLKAALGDEYCFGSNIINNITDANYGQRIVDMYIEKNIRLASASAFMDLTLPLVQYASQGLALDEGGNIVRKNILFSKISRVELAEKLMCPAPKEMLIKLVDMGKLTAMEASLAEKVPVSQFVTVEADSGGHTDNRPLTCLLPAVKACAKQMKEKFRYPSGILVGAAGGIGTPSALLAAFAMQADYVLTGSINQCSLEANQSQFVKEMLTHASMTDVMMAPAADMFEQGINVQVLKNPTLFPMRAKKLYHLYSQYDAIECIPANEIMSLKAIFKIDIEEVWRLCQEYFNKVDPQQMIKANRDPKHKMALIFRWYLGSSSKWAIQGTPDRKQDYQIWCGPAMGAFNDWVKGTPLEKLENRSIVQIAYNLMYGTIALSKNEAYMPHRIDLENERI